MNSDKKKHKADDLLQKTIFGQKTIHNIANSKIGYPVSAWIHVKKEVQFLVSILSLRLSFKVRTIV